MSERNQSLHFWVRAKVLQRCFVGEILCSVFDHEFCSLPPRTIQPRSSLGVDAEVLDPRVYLPGKEVSRSCCVSGVHGLVQTSQEDLSVCPSASLLQEVSR